ncbi:hypothetical protein ES705_42372 [subsurface metagenome]|nr:MAG: hypothetical protein ES695_16760 [Candidatus Atribacteria bacterium 1244-E10-H5-B2]
MKKNIFISLIVLCILVIFTLILFAEEVKYDFRKTNWGMSIEQVKATENAKLDLEIDSILFYSGVRIDEIYGEDFSCTYFFSEDKLFLALYVISEEHTNDNLYIRDYENLKKVLTKKYGKPKINKTTWNSDFYKNDESKWGFAVSVGDLSYFSSWETPTTLITLELSGDNYEIKRNGLNYESKEYLKEQKDKESKVLEEKAKSKF